MSDTDQRSVSMRELTVRGIILGGLITLLFTAANVYLGLKVGLTFATSIPAAVISMAILRFLSGATILENNIVQTIASAAGTLAAIIFVLPGLVIVGWWQGFPYWTTAAVCFIGGTLGVMFSVPLRRALVAGSDLPYPEGVAAAEVLKVGSRAGEGAEENQRGLRTILLGSLISAGFSLLGAMKLAALEVSKNFKLGAGATGVSGSLSFALIGVGHLVGLSVGVAMFIGMVIAWAGLMPALTAAQGLTGPVDDVVGMVFSQQVRFIGAGTIGVAALWTLLKIVGPIVKGIKGSIASSRARGAGEVVELGERDLSFGIVAGTILGSLIPIAGLLWFFAQSGPIAANPVGVIFATLLFVLFVGAIIAAVTGYMAGLIGASNSPVSGVGILAIIAASLMLLLFFGRNHSEADTAALVAYALFTTAIVFSVATISNDNLQDLKTGQLVGATPWMQQLALVIGVGFGSLIIPPVLDLLNQAFGRRPALGFDRLWCIDRRRDHRRRRDIGAHGQAAPAAARRRHGHLSADVADLAHSDRRGDRPFLGKARRTQRSPRILQPDGRLAGDGLHRWREHFRGIVRGRRRGFGKRCAAGAGRGELRADGDHRRPFALRRADRIQLSAHAPRDRKRLTRLPLAAQAAKGALL